MWILAVMVFVGNSYFDLTPRIISITRMPKQECQQEADAINQNTWKTGLVAHCYSKIYKERRTT